MARWTRTCEMGVFIGAEFGRNLANRSNQFAATVNHRFELQNAASVTVHNVSAQSLLPT